MMHQGREVRLCCAGCIKPFESDPGKYFAKIDEKIVADQLAIYPLETCPVSQQPLGAMGKPVNFVHNNRLVRFCCNGCVGPWDRKSDDEKAEYIASLNK